jgi:microcompartment protein CcmL/EutN
VKAGRRPSLGLVETPFLGVTALSCDAALKAAEVTLLGLEPIGTEVILSRFAGDAGSVRAAVQAAGDRARSLGAGLRSASILDAPDPRMDDILRGSDAVNPLYGGREYFLPSARPEKTIMKTPAIGILETQGLTAILYATDAMLKAANVELVGKEKIGAAYVTIIVRGDVAAVKASIEAGRQAVGDLGKIIAAEVIARPHDDLLRLLPAA